MAEEAPSVDHQPIPCTVPDKPISVCAGVSAESQVAKVSLYFRRAGEEFYNFVDMSFSGLNYCGTLPAPRSGKMQALEYYIQAVDDKYQSKRTSTYQMAVKSEGSCDFPPIEKDATRASAITVHATNKKQGHHFDEAFSPTGVTFVAVSP